MNRRVSQFGVFSFIAACIIFGQNCGKQSIQFEKTGGEQLASLSTDSNDLVVPEDMVSPVVVDEELPPEDDFDFQEGEVICDPLTGGEGCDETLAQGLRGAIYSLTPELFPGDRNRARIDDYIQLGLKLPNDIIMSKIDVPNQDWVLGFQAGNGDYLRDNNGEKLNEYFALDLHGYVQFPESMNGKMIELASYSDDGIRISVEGQKILEEDGTHALTWSCDSGVLNFAPGEKKKIRVQYFQGPRTKIALQLFYREITSGKNGCEAQTGWKLFEAKHFSH